MKLPVLAAWPKAEADVVIGKIFLNDEQEDRLKSFLSFSNPAFYQKQKEGVDTTGVSPFIFAYEDCKQFFRVPRHTPWRKIGIREPRPEFPDTRKLSWEFKGTFRDEIQEQAFTALRHQLIYRKDGILVLSAGKGKTVIATAGFSWMQRPALAIVPQLFIGEQWKKALLEFTDIPEDRIGMIGDGQSEWKNKDFVIATIQTLAQKDFPWQFYRRFGLIYYDEVHRLGASHFGKVAPMFTGVRIGLTATLERSDRMHELFMMHLGKVFFENKEQQLIPRIHFLKTPVKKDLKGFRQWRARRGQLNMAKIITHISRLPERQAFVVHLIKEAYTKNRKVLYISERKEELLALQELLGKKNTGICVGSLDGRHMKQNVRNAALSQPITLATSQLVKEGLDKPDIDTLIIGYPASSEIFSEQSAGRILRLDDEKKHPVIVVLMDSGCYVEEAYGNKRRPFKQKCIAMQRTWKRLGYDIVQGVTDGSLPALH
jgi:superfamily II DNA or RNA helicase